MIWQHAKNILSGLAIALIAGLGITAVVTKANHGQLLSVQTGSMVPNLNRGDLVQVTRVSAAELQKGDIVTFINPKDAKSTITHRIIELPNDKHPGMLITKGDANQAADAPHPVGKVVGKVNWHVPYAGKAVDFVRQPIGLIALIYIPALLIIVGELKRLTKYYETQKPYIDPIHEKPKRGPTIFDRALSGLGYVSLIAVMTLIGSLVSVRADLMATVKLTGNTITAVGGGGSGGGSNHVVIKELCLRCSRDNTASAARRPMIYIYNPTKEKVNLEGWTLRDNSGIILTIGTKTLQKNSTYVVRPFLSTGGQNGLQYAGDHVSLYNAAGVKVDGLSWGSDTTELSPSIPAVTPGTNFIRYDKKTDTDKATDWRIRDIRCHGEPKSNNHDQDGDDTPDGLDESTYDTSNQNLIPSLQTEFTLEPRDG